VLETDANPTLTASYSIPDVGDVNKALVFNGGANMRQPYLETCPSLNTKGMPNPLLEATAWEAGLRKLLADWAWLPRQVAYNAGGTAYSLPTTAYNGRDMTKFAGVWILRSQILAPVKTSTPTWIDACVTYLKTKY
jgi:hypothetical protein